MSNTRCRLVYIWLLYLLSLQTCIPEAPQAWSPQEYYDHSRCCCKNKEVEVIKNKSVIWKYKRNDVINGMKQDDRKNALSGVIVEPDRHDLPGNYTQALP